MWRCLPAFILLIGLLQSGQVPAFAQSPLGMSFPVHGNWCGLGHGGGAFSRPPVDPLDQSCMIHDACTVQMGQFNCGCDILFMQDLRATRWPNPSYQAKARAIYDAIAMMPCTDPAGQAVKAEMVTRDWMANVTSGREAPWEIFLRWGYLGLHGFERTMREGTYP